MKAETIVIIGKPARERVGNDERDQDRDHEHGGRDENAGALAGRTTAGMIGASQGANSAGLALATKNSTSGPKSSASLSNGLSCGLFGHPMFL